MAVAGKQIDGFVFRHQVARLLPWDFNHAFSVVHFEMGETVCFFAVFLDDAVKRGLQAGHFDWFEQIVCGSQLKRAQCMFFVGCGGAEFENLLARQCSLREAAEAVFALQRQSFDELYSV